MSASSTSAVWGAFAGAVGGVAGIVKAVAIGVSGKTVSGLFLGMITCIHLLLSTSFIAACLASLAASIAFLLFG
jgi:hypothetical protein